MKMRQFCSLLALTTFLTSFAIAGVQTSNTGGTCPPSNTEGQGTGSSSDRSEKHSDPIYLATGDFQHTNTDLFIPGRGLDFEMKRFYRSKSGLYSTLAADLNHDGEVGSDPRVKTPLGINWEFTYNMRLDWYDGAIIGLFGPGEGRPLPPVLYLYDGTGRRDAFQTDAVSAPSPSIEAIYANDKHNSAILYTTNDAGAKLVDAEQVTYLFHPFFDASDVLLPYAGRLASITDRNGNQITFSYETTANGFERLASAVDTLGHLITFKYHDDPASPMSLVLDEYTEPLLWKVSDHAGREVEYLYENPSADYTTRLISARLPEIKDTADFPLVFIDNGIAVNHERFLTGRLWQYEYDPAPSPDWPGVDYRYDDGMLTKITNPNGDVITENTYADPFGSDRTAGRVTRQVFGDEVYNYVVTNDRGNEEASGTGFDYYVWVNDRRGVITRFKYARRQNSYTDVPGQPDEPRNRQLLETKVFDGFVDNPDLQVWAVSSSGGEPTSWRYYDTNGMVQTLAKGPETPDGAGGTSGPWTSTTTEYVPDRNWNITGSGVPNGINLGQSYQNHDYPPLPGNAPDPRFNRTVTSRTVSSDDGSESITEYWRYDFDFGGGCGCGSAGFNTAYQDGKGYVTIKEYDSKIDPVTGNPSGDLLAIYHDLPIGTSMETLPLAAESLAAAVDKYPYYNEWGQVLTHTHPSKKIIDSQGDVDDHTRVDQFEYYSNQADQNNYGRLHKKHIDVNGFNLVTTYVYDIIGNVIQVIEPDGDVTNFYYNQDAELVREQSYDDVAETTLFAQTDYFYDANGNLVLEEELNLDGNQLLVTANKSITSVYEYDKLDYMTKSSYEAGVFTGTISSFGDGSGRFTAPITNSLFVSQIREYDAAQNLIQFSDGEAVNGVDATNIVTHEYDARELRIKTIVGPGSISPLVTEFEYDDEDRLVVSRVDPDDALQIQKTEWEYDAFDRITKRVDPMGNEYRYAYDDNHNPIELEIYGPVLQDATDGAESSELLARMTRVYGELDLKENQSVDIFGYDYSTGTSISSSSSQTTSYFYNEDSSIHEIAAPSGHATLLDERKVFYDTASRLGFNEDVSGNITQYEYDADSNISKLIQSDVPSQGAAVEVYTVLYEYDALDRQTAVIDGVGNRSETKYDSRSNSVVSTDARGNIHAYTYDSLSRMTGTSTKMMDTGDGNGMQIAGDAGTITTASDFDDSSRLISETDDNGNTTSYEYDGLNRLSKITMPDGEMYLAQYDANGNVVTYIDARGVVISQMFDLNSRLTTRTISGTTVPGTSSESFTYDGLGRLRTAENGFAKITREYDSRMNVIREIQNIDQAGGFPAASDRVVDYAFDVANNNSNMTYPSGREIYRTYDELNRLAGIFNDNLLADPITEFGYIGRRLATRANGNGTITGYQYSGFDGALVETDDFGFGRVNKITTSKVSTGTIFDAFTFTWDKAQNRTSYKDKQSGMKNRRERDFGYDSADRLISTDVDYPDPLTDNSAPANNGITTYSLDGVHNRTDVSGYENNGAPLGAYSQSGDQAANNQYSLTPREVGGEWAYVYDENGNMVIKAQNSLTDFNGDYTHNSFDISSFTAAFNAGDMSADFNGDGVLNFFDISSFIQDFGAVSGLDLEHWHYTYDFRNQLIGVSEELGPNVLSTVTNTYDSAARRVSESISIGSVNESCQFVYGCTSLWEVIEQIDLLNNDELLSTHVFGIGIDDEVSYRLEDLAIPEDIWAHRDDLNSLTSISDESGDVIERYEYGDYGEVAYFDASGTSLPASLYSAHHLFTGRSLIIGTGLYDYRFRVMEPGTGRFNQRDPIGTSDSLNLYQYARKSPYKFIDPMGLSSTEPTLSTPQMFIEKCAQIEGKIKNIKINIERRMKDRITNPRNQPYAHPLDHVLPSVSQRGHDWLIEEDRRRLRQLEDAYDKNNCKNGKPPCGEKRPYQIPPHVESPKPYAPMLPKGAPAAPTGPVFNINIQWPTRKQVRNGAAVVGGGASVVIFWLSYPIWGAG